MRRAHVGVAHFRRRTQPAILIPVSRPQSVPIVRDVIRLSIANPIRRKQQTGLVNLCNNRSVRDVCQIMTLYLCRH